MRTLLNKIRKLRASIRLCITMVAYFTHWTNFWNNFVIYYRRRLWLLNSVLPVHPFDNSCKPVIFADRQCNLFTKTSQHNIVFLFGNTEIFLSFFFYLYACPFFPLLVFVFTTSLDFARYTITVDFDTLFYGGTVLSIEEPYLYTINAFGAER